MEEEQIEVAVPETAEEEVTPEVTEETEEATEETVDEVRERLAKAEELANNYKIRAEKAEKKSKETVKPDSGITSKDTIALMNAKVHEDDIDEIVEYAKFKKVSVSDALKSGVIKSILAERVEQRTTAEATNTSKTRGTSSKVSGETLLEKAQKTGELPTSDADIVELAKARLANR